MSGQRPPGWPSPDWDPWGADSNPSRRSEPPEPVPAPAAPVAPVPPLIQPKKSNKGLLTLLVAGGTILTALVVFLAFFFGRQDKPAPTSKPADGAVRFLQAVAAGDAAGALAAQVDAPPERTLLTNAVLAESRALAPISQIRVTLDTPTKVELAYLLGDREAKATFEPVRQPDGLYKVRHGTTTMQVSLPKQVPLLVNGVPVSSPEVQAFPGAYRMATGLNNLRINDPDFTVSGPTSSPRLTPVAELTDSGRSAFLTAARDQLTKCAAAKDLNPPNCPQRVELSPDHEVDATSVVWTQVGDPFPGAIPRLSLVDESVAEVQLTVEMRLKATGRSNGKPGVTDDTLRFATTATGRVTTEPITVRFVM